MRNNRLNVIQIIVKNGWFAPQVVFLADELPAKTLQKTFSSFFGHLSTMEATSVSKNKMAYLLTSSTLKY
jgi:hypothetical protein